MKLLFLGGKPFLLFNEKIVNVDHIQGFLLDVKMQAGEGFIVEFSTGREFILYKEISREDLFSEIFDYLGL